MEVNYHQTAKDLAIKLLFLEDLRASANNLVRFSIYSITIERFFATKWRKRHQNKNIIIIIYLTISLSFYPMSFFIRQLVHIPWISLTLYNIFILSLDIPFSALFYILLVFNRKLTRLEESKSWPLTVKFKIRENINLITRSFSILIINIFFQDVTMIPMILQEKIIDKELLGIIKDIIYSIRDVAAIISLIVFIKGISINNMFCNKKTPKSEDCKENGKRNEGDIYFGMLKMKL
uniref:7TM_GPCR_Srx domain-containing protein n=1 Tax=Strongyloides papillosus TaxID=174720 RepID=A0A0N5BP72_STREA